LPPPAFPAILPFSWTREELLTFKAHSLFFLCDSSSMTFKLRLGKNFGGLLLGPFRFSQARGFKGNFDPGSNWLDHLWLGFLSLVSSTDCGFSLGDYEDDVSFLSLWKPLFSPHVPLSSSTYERFLKIPTSTFFLPFCCLIFTSLFFQFRRTASLSG